MSDERLALLSGLYPLADDDPRWRHGPREVVEAALAGGATVVQLRLKHSADRDALELARWAVARARAHGAALFRLNRLKTEDSLEDELLLFGGNDKTILVSLLEAC